MADAAARMSTIEWSELHAEPASGGRLHLWGITRDGQFRESYADADVAADFTDEAVVALAGAAEAFGTR